MTTDGMLVLEAIERGLRQLPGQLLVCEPLPRAQSQLSKGGGVSPGVLSAQKTSPAPVTRQLAARPLAIG